MESLEARVRQILSVGEQCIEPTDLNKLLRSKQTPMCYDGFEPSGRIHIAQGIMKVYNVNQLMKSGCGFKIWVADWFALLNHKMGSDLVKIQKVGRYMLEVWKAAGIDSNVQFLWSSREINSRAGEYWSLVFDIARQNTLPRLVRCSQIMGRNNMSQLYASALLYACMQCADIFFLKADICQLGEDQRKVNMLAREYAQIKKYKTKPIILSHHMLPGLKQGHIKMSKSDSDSAIFMDDNEAEVTRKIKEAYCPDTCLKNPCLEYIKYIILPWNGSFDIKLDDGNTNHYSSSDELYSAWESKSIPADRLKSSLAEALNCILKPVRERLMADPEVEKLVEEVNELARKEAERKRKNAEKEEEEERVGKNELIYTPLELSRIGQISDDEMKVLSDKFPKEENPTLLISFEPRHRMGIGEGMMVGIVNKLIDEGFTVKILIHDWLVKDTTTKLETAANVVLNLWKAKGMRMEEIQVIWSSKIFQQLVPLMFDVSVRFDLLHIFRGLGLAEDVCGDVEDECGLSEDQKKISPSLILDACIHCAGLLHLKPEICIVIGMEKPMLVSSFFSKQNEQPMMVKPATLLSLDGNGGEMSNVDDEASCLFLDDGKNELKKKIRRAFCPPSVIEKNPCVEIVRNVILPNRGQLRVLRRPEHGGDRVYESMNEIEEDYISGALHPQDLKASIVDGLLC